MSTHAAPRLPLSPLRIGALSSTLALHLAAFGLLVLPSTMLLSAIEEKPAEIVVDFITAEVPPPPIPVPPVPPPPVRPHESRPVETPREQVVIVDSDYAVVAPPTDPVIQPEGEPTVDVRPAPTSAAAIAYADVPAPPYPPMARKRNWEGDVLLRVRVDENGKPVAVEIQKSSGHRLLDRTARDHVLRRWRFQPALIDGRPVQAWALVPLSFRIEAG